MLCLFYIKYNIKEAFVNIFFELIDSIVKRML